MGQISFTVDMWSDQNRHSYLAITAHWIARRGDTDVDVLTLRAALIAFHRLRSRHDGQSLADAVLRLLDRAGITDKVRLSGHLYNVLTHFFHRSATLPSTTRPTIGR
jgi:hypothetical protein